MKPVEPRYGCASSPDESTSRSGRHAGLGAITLRSMATEDQSQGASLADRVDTGIHLPFPAMPEHIEPALQQFGTFSLRDIADDKLIASKR